MGQGDQVVPQVRELQLGQMPRPRPHADQRERGHHRDQQHPLRRIERRRDQPERKRCDYEERDGGGRAVLGQVGGGVRSGQRVREERGGRADRSGRHREAQHTAYEIRAGSFVRGREREKKPGMPMVSDATSVTCRGRNGNGRPTMPISSASRTE